MKLKWVVGSIMLASAMAMALPANAAMVQRGCKPDDIQLNNPQATTCTWVAGDSNMQVTFHGAPGATNAKVNCTFDPKGGGDNVAAVQGHKGATISNVYDDGINIRFDLQAPSSGENANVMFWLNKPYVQTSFNPGDTLSCTVSAVHGK